VKRERMRLFPWNKNLKPYKEYIWVKLCKKVAEEYGVGHVTVGEKADRMSHSGVLNSMKTTLAYTEQQREVTATDVLLFKYWRDSAIKKMKEAQKKIPITNFLKK
jgi:hypothetical protein